MKNYFSVLVIFISFSCVGQDIPGVKNKANGFSRAALSEPPYGLQKIKKKLSAVYGADYKPDKAFYASLPLKEKFTYHMVHGESYMQICSILMPDPNEQKKLFVYLPGRVFNEYGWSTEQRKFFVNNRDSVISLMRETIVATHRVGLNFKTVIVDLHAKELMQTLVNAYLPTKKDHDILTVLMLLMKENKYAPFTSSPFFKKLYGANSDYSSSVVFNTADEASIIAFAGKFYQDAVK